MQRIAHIASAIITTNIHMYADVKRYDNTSKIVFKTDIKKLTIDIIVQHRIKRLFRFFLFLCFILYYIDIIKYAYAQMCECVCVQCLFVFFLFFKLNSIHRMICIFITENKNANTRTSKHTNTQTRKHNKTRTRKQIVVSNCWRGDGTPPDTTKLVVGSVFL